MITDEELSSLNSAIYARFGMDFRNYEPVSFRRRVSRVIDKFGVGSSLGLWSRLINDKTFIHTFMDEITVGLTQMFRNSDFWIKLRSDVVPELRAKPEFSVWHAGCSTGEEVYSLAILLAEENLLHKARVLATDLNSQSVRMAQEGVVSNYYTQAYEENYRVAGGKRKLSDYYTAEEDNIRFNKLPTQGFQFCQHNLTKDGMTQPFDLIFCRNVMIYFDETLKLRVLQLFHNSLKENGILVIGYYDALPAGYKELFELQDPQTRIFRKKAVQH